MRNFIRVGVLCAAAAPLVAAGYLYQESKPAPAGAGALSYFSGSWQCRMGNMTVEEHWTKPGGKTLIGMGRTIAKGATVEFEFLRVEERADGLVYVAQPGGKAPTEFRATAVKDGEIVFENPQHDFPKRIIYRKNGEGLMAQIDGGEGVNPMQFDYKPLR